MEHRKYIFNLFRIKSDKYVNALCSGKKIYNDLVFHPFFKHSRLGKGGMEYA